MATSTSDPEKVTSCSHDQQETKEVEYSFSKNKDPGVEPTSSSDEVKFKPNIPATPVIDITDKQAIFAIVSFTLVSVALGFLLYLGTLKDELDPVSLILFIQFEFFRIKTRGIFNDRSPLTYFMNQNQDHSRILKYLSVPSNYELTFHTVSKCAFRGDGVTSSFLGRKGHQPIISIILANISKRICDMVKKMMFSRRGRGRHTLKGGHLISGLFPPHHTIKNRVTVFDFSPYLLLYNSDLTNF